jgi:hypothetical protein
MRRDRVGEDDGVRHDNSAAPRPPRRARQPGAVLFLLLLGFGPVSLFVCVLMSLLCLWLVLYCGSAIYAFVWRTVVVCLFCECFVK